MQLRPNGAGGQDWPTIWRTMYDAERAQGEATTDPDFGRNSDTWAHRANRYARAIQRVAQPDSFMRRLLQELRPTDTVIDVGAGTGRHIPTLARGAARVIAVEPSPAMRAELEAVVAGEGLHNVEIHSTAWPLVEPIQADIVVSSHVIYGVREIVPFLEGMNVTAKRACFLYLGLKHPASGLAPFWEHIYGEPRMPLPAALEAFCCLHQLGYEATFELIEIEPSFYFTDRDSALDEIRNRLRLTPNAERDARITTAIDTLLSPAPQGGLTLANQPRRAAVIRWAPAT